MSNHSYFAPHGGHPGQTELLTDRAMFTEAYAVIPKGVMRDIVTSHLPFWDKMRMWVIARPLTGFAETFSQYIVEVAPEGGSERPELDPNAEAVLFVVEGEIDITVEGKHHTLVPGGYAFLAPGPTGVCATTASPTSPSTGCASTTRRSKAWLFRNPSSPTARTQPSSKCRAPKAAGSPPASSTWPTCATTCTSTS